MKFTNWQNQFGFYDSCIPTVANDSFWCNLPSIANLSDFTDEELIEELKMRRHNAKKLETLIDELLGEGSD